MKKTKKLNIYAVAMPMFTDDVEYMMTSYDMDNSEYNTYVLIETREIEFEIDDTRDIPGEMTANAIYSLRKQKKDVLADSQIKANDIQDRIDSLLAIEDKATQ